MKIVYVLESYPPQIGGAERLFENICFKIANKNNDIVVVTSSQNCRKHSKIITKNLKVYYYPWLRVSGHAIPSFIDVYPHIIDSDIIHTATYTAAPTAFFLAKFLRKKSILTAYEALGKKWFEVEKNVLKAILFFLFEKFVISLNFDHYHAISNATARDIEKNGVNKNKITTIYPGLSIDRITKSPTQNSKTFLFYGRPGVTKGIWVLLEAINKLSSSKEMDKSYKFKLILSAEPNSERQKIVNYVKSNKLSKIILISSSLKRSDLIKEISTSFCVIVPSITEGFGFSAVEACMLNKPVIISDAGSLPEVSFGKILIFKNKNIDDLKEKILLAINNQFETILVKKFLWDDSITMLNNLYKNVLK